MLILQKENKVVTISTEVDHRVEGNLRCSQKNPGQTLAAKDLGLSWGFSGYG